MARFNINTFAPVYPQTDDKRGEVQEVRINETQEVSEYYTQEMRLDYLPVMQAIGNKMAAGVQTMYRTVEADNDLLLWVDTYGSGSFLQPLSGHSVQNLDWQTWIYDNTQQYQAMVNAYLSELGQSHTVSITRVHVIDSNIQFAEANSQHIFFQTAKCIFYGQENPNPNPPTPPTPPPPPCEQMTGYTLGKQFPIGVSNTKVSWTPLTGGGWQWTLTAKGGGAGTSSIIVQNNGTFDPFIFTVGSSYFLQIETDAIPVAGSTIAIGGVIQGSQNINFVISDTANTLYFPLIVQSNAWTFRFTCSAQVPASGLSQTPNISFRIRIFNGTCVNP